MVKKLRVGLQYQQREISAMAEMLGGKARQGRSSRRDVLLELVPKILAIVSSRGAPISMFAGMSAFVKGDIVVCQSPHPVAGAMVSVYWPLCDNPKKVLSVRAGSRRDEFDLLVWQRGTWEGAIMTDPVQARKNELTLIAGGSHRLH